MSWTKETTIWCDALDCMEWFACGLKSVNETRTEAAQQDGWRYIPAVVGDKYEEAKDLCPMHVPT